MHGVHAAHISSQAYPQPASLYHAYRCSAGWAAGWASSPKPHKRRRSPARPLPQQDLAPKISTPNQDSPPEQPLPRQATAPKKISSNPQGPAPTHQHNTLASSVGDLAPAHHTHSPSMLAARDHNHHHHHHQLSLPAAEPCGSSLSPSASHPPRSRANHSRLRHSTQG